ncbi:MAG TPA: chaperone NapD [Gammaproteobacteria bacterium]|nr:chaperone NapD [Gammaproteobacteria bacterium]
MSAARHYAGVLVTAEPGQLDDAVDALDGIDGVRVYYRERSTARCVAVLETDDRAGQEQLFRRVQDLAEVRGADLVYHLIDNETESKLALEQPAS